MNRVAELRTRIIAEIKKEKMVTTWHWNDFFDDCVDIMGWNEKDITGNMRRLRYHLNKMVKEGILQKGTIGTGYCGKTDFGHTHSNYYEFSPIYKVSY